MNIGLSSTYFYAYVFLVLLKHDITLFAQQNYQEQVESFSRYLEKNGIHNLGISLSIFLNQFEYLFTDETGKRSSFLFLTGIQRLFSTLPIELRDSGITYEEIVSYMEILYEQYQSHEQIKKLVLISES